MIVVDSSAVVAIIFKEPGRERLADAITAADKVLISAATYMETASVVAGRLPRPRDALMLLDIYLQDAGIEMVPLDEDQARAGIEGRLRFGKGFGVRKGPNLGDTFAYGLAKTRNLPLLFVGDDFTHTDIVSALP